MPRDELWFLQRTPKDEVDGACGSALLFHDGRNKLEWDKATSMYEKVFESMLLSFEVEVYSTRTNSGFPLFTVCFNCFGVVRELMAYRNKHPTWSISHPIRSLEDLYRGLYHQFQLDGKNSPDEKKASLNWDHMCFVGSNIMEGAGSNWIPSSQVSRSLC